jgi:hypothetical protein
MAGLQTLEKTCIWVFWPNGIERDCYLEAHHPEHFGEIQEKYDGQLEDIGKKIAELEQVDV